MESIAKVAPFKVARLKNKTPEWFDMEVYDKIKLRVKRFKKFKKSKLHRDSVLYIEARNDVNRTIKRKKVSYVKDKLQENINEPKSLWKTLKSLGMPSKRSSMAKICLQKNDNICFEPKGISEIFRDYFSGIAGKLASKLPPAPNVYCKSSTKLYYDKFYKDRKNFSFTECCDEQIQKILENFNITKAAGIDNLHSRFLKDGAEILSSPLKQICNLSLKLSVFPNECKIAKLKPLFKKGSSTDAKNYRPISLLPLISKVLEKVVLEQTQHFLKENKLLYELQSGFRDQHSTNFCLSYLSDTILSGFDSGLFTGMILIDLQKAFDTIDHNVLLEKLEIIGFSESTVRWYQSYLQDKKFFVSIEKTLSRAGKFECGVPQGSILGPLLFLLYINDLKQASESTLLLYADDSCIIYQNADIKLIENKLNHDFNNICNWFIDNKLSIHLGEDKTKCILFAPKYKKKAENKLNIFYQGLRIQQYSSVTYLGCILDEAMTGEEMALFVIKKINSKLKFLYRKQLFLSKFLRHMLCNAIIHPHFDYACTSWYVNLSKKLKNKLQVTQNKCIRFCLQKHGRAHIGYEEFLDINWLPTLARVQQMVLCNVFNYFQKSCPVFIAKLFSPVNHVTRVTRSSVLRLLQPKRKTNAGLNSLSYVGPSYWNKLPMKLKTPMSLNSFKHLIKNYFLEQIKNDHAPLFIYE